jgi:hypothetical protein
MNRRSFLRTLAAVPLAAVAARTLVTAPPALPMLADPGISIRMIRSFDTAGITRLDCLYGFRAIGDRHQCVVLS